MKSHWIAQRQIKPKNVGAICVCLWFETFKSSHHLFVHHFVASTTNKQQKCAPQPLFVDWKGAGVANTNNKTRLSTSTENKSNSCIFIRQGCKLYANVRNNALVFYRPSTAISMSIYSMDDTIYSTYPLSVFLLHSKKKTSAHIFFGRAISRCKIKNFRSQNSLHFKIIQNAGSCLNIVEKKRKMHSWTISPKKTMDDTHKDGHARITMVYNRIKKCLCRRLFLSRVLKSCVLWLQKCFFSLLLCLKEERSVFRQRWNGKNPKQKKIMRRNEGEGCFPLT